jgi:HAD superfamily hydrolase (TIGR01509 family)
MTVKNDIMTKTGYVFDFNGTLFWDSKYQDYSWDIYLRKYGIMLSEKEKEKYVHGRNSKDTFEYLFRRKLSFDEVQDLTEEKEKIYRNVCLKNFLKLAPGADELLCYLKEKEYPMTIATASGKTNVDFFIQEFNLEKYFETEKIVYDDGTIPGKPNPDLFLNAMKKIKTQPADTIIFEDSVSGILAAERAKAKKVIIVNSTNSDYSKFMHQVIHSFAEFQIE